MRKRYLGIVDFATRRRVTIAMITLGVVVFGLVAWARLPVTLLPDIDYPTLTVQTELDGAAPKEVEYLLTRPLEETLATTSGVRRVVSRSRAGESEISLEFEWGTAMDTAVVDVRERLERASLPREAEPPQVLRFDPNTAPIMRLAVSAEDDDLRALRRHAEDEFARSLETRPGVAAARVSGGRDGKIQVHVDDDRLADLDLDLAGLRDRLENENVRMAGGNVHEGARELLVRTVNRFDDLDDIRRTVVERRNGAVIHLEDIAEVRFGHADPDAILRLDGEEAVEVAVYREGDANTVQVANDVRDTLARLEANLPAGMAVATVQDQSRFIRMALNEVVSAAVLGGLLAALVLYLFLGQARPTVIIALSIPLAVTGTFVLMHATGVGLNVMSLGGIALAVGLLVDSAIVVLESIARRREAGDTPVEAARRGAGEVGGAIIAATLTTVAVFLPLAFVEGLAGQLFGDQALAISFSLLLALVIALAVIPMLASAGRDRDPDANDNGNDNTRAATAPKGAARLRGWRDGVLSGLLALLRLPFRLAARLAGLATAPLVAGFQKAWQWVERAYEPVLTAALARPGRVWLAALAVVGLAALLLPRLGTEVMPEVRQGEFDLVVELEPGTALGRTDTVLDDLREELEGRDLPIADIATMAGSGDRLDTAGAEDGENVGRLTVRMADRADGMDELAAREAARAVASRFGLRHRVESPEILDFDTELVLALSGEDLPTLGEASDRARAAMAENGHFADIRASLDAGHPEVRIRFDRELLASLEMTAGDAAERVAEHIQGRRATRLSMPDRELDIHVRGSEERRRSLEALYELPINPGVPRSLPLAAVAELEVTHGPVEIRREGQQRVAAVAAQPTGPAGEASAELERLISELELPAGIQARPAGQADDLDEAFATMLLALGLSIFLVYLVMASQFESLLHPLVILFTVPLALAGAVIGLWLSGSTLSVIVFVGLMMLGGIIVNNAIVLVDRINRARADGLGLTEAVRQAAQTRLRPIVMTTATTVLALLPLALGTGEGAELRTPMAVTVIGGLVAGTLLTLVVIPTSYHWLEAQREPQS